MSEDLTVATEQAQPQPQINQEEQTKANLAYAAFGGEKPTTDAAQPEVVATEQSAPAQEQIVNTPATPQFIADLGYASEDDFKAAYQELKTKAETPATKEEIKFANDESKRIYEAIAAGKTKEVKSYLEAQELLSNVDSMDNEAKLKLYIKMQNPKFNQDLVNDEYTELYTLSEDRIAELELEPMKLQKE